MHNVTRSDGEAAGDSVTQAEATKMQPSSPNLVGYEETVVFPAPPRPEGELVPRRNLVYRDDNIAYVSASTTRANYTLC